MSSTQGTLGTHGTTGTHRGGRHHHTIGTNPTYQSHHTASLMTRGVPVYYKDINANIFADKGRKSGGGRLIKPTGKYKHF